MRAATWAPPVTIVADGRTIAEDDLRAMTQVRVQSRLSLPTQCELTFVDPPGPLHAVQRWRPGTPLRVLARGQDIPLFEGDVTVQEHSYAATGAYTLRVRGYDRLARLRKRRPARVHVQLTLRELAEQLARDLGVQVDVADPGLLWEQLIQQGESDLEFLLALAEPCGYYATLRGNLLHLCTLEGIGPAIPLRWGETLLEARVEVSGEPALRSVESSGWDPLRVEGHRGSTASARGQRSKHARVDPAAVGGTGIESLTGEMVLQDRHAEALAQGELDRHVAREVTFWGIAEGDTALRPGAQIEVQGLDAGAAESGLNNRFTLISVLHTIDAERGFVSELSSTPPPPRPREQQAVATLGVISDVRDPEGLGRVRAALPAYNNLETAWMHVLSVGAGANKGVMILPDRGDTVLVLLTHRDPGRGIVLGGLYGMRGMPDSGVEADKVRRYTFLTPGGQKVTLDDARHNLRLENDSGSYVELSPHLVRLHAAADLEIEAPGRSVKVRGQRIDFERA